MKISISFLLTFWILMGYSHTKIYIKSPISRQHDYQLEKESDSKFIYIGHSEDMGSVYGQHYSIKSTIRDGKYEVYVDGNLELVSFIKDGKKDSICTTYFETGVVSSIKTFNDDKLNGEIIDYYPSGKVRSFGTFIDNQPHGTGLSYFESGEVEVKNHNFDGIYVKQEVFDIKGNLIYCRDF